MRVLERNKGVFRSLTTKLVIIMHTSENLCQIKTTLKQWKRHLHTKIGNTDSSERFDGLACRKLGGKLGSQSRWAFVLGLARLGKEETR